MAEENEEIAAARLGARYTAIGVALALLSVAVQRGFIHLLHASVEAILVISAMFTIGGFIQAFRGRATVLGIISMLVAGALLLLACMHTVFRVLAWR